MICPAVLMAALAALTPDAGPSRTQVMHDALHAVLHLQPLLMNAGTFSAAKNQPLIFADLDALAQVEHSFRGANPSDPGAIGIAAALTSQVKSVRANLESGEPERARTQLQGVTALCFSCHTLAESPGLDAATATATETLTPLEQARFWAATRHFDQALALWLVALKRPPETFEQAATQLAALRQALVVSVSVKDDPVKTLELLKARASGEFTAGYTLPWAPAWQAEATTWAAEHFEARAQTPKQLFIRGRALIEKSGAAAHLLADETKTIGLLRATAYLTQAITREPQAGWRGEALFGLGVATSTVREPMLWGLGSVYLEACIRENSGTPVAQRCFSTLMERTLFGFTGSSGTHVPPEVGEQLAALAKLAAPLRPVAR